MDNLFILNKDACKLDLEDGFHERLIQLDAVANTLLISRDSAVELNRDTFYNVLWAICELLDELTFLKERLDEYRRADSAP